jgi:pyruvate ferredoxin oxidoreductase beta subunit
MEKVKKAAAVRGPSYIHCHSPCPTGWGIDTKDVVKVARLAVSTGFVALFEIVDGQRRLTKRRGRKVPVEEYLKHQARFRHVLDDPELLARIQEGVDARYAELEKTLAA